MGLVRMTDNPSSNFVPNKRGAPRFALPLDVELQRIDQPEAAWTTAKLRELSVRDFYFLSPEPYKTGDRFRFSVPLRQEQSSEDRRLLGGIASIVRCDELDPFRDGSAFGIVARIDEVTP